MIQCTMKCMRKEKKKSDQELQQEHQMCSADGERKFANKQMTCNHAIYDVGGKKGRRNQI